MQDKYNPLNIESKWYSHWEKNGYFSPTLNKDKKNFTIQLPPPNVTGVLHMGHAFNQTIIDTLIRYHRMLGDNTCWLPGFDHSGIATQIVIERQLAAQGKNRHDLGREAFLQRIWQWKQESGGTRKEQMKRMGCSVDWDKEYFTMDEKRAEAVTTAFVRLYQQNLIYRGKRLVNWDPALGTAISDLEVENNEENGWMWYIRYSAADNREKSLMIATTRPETLLGDVALAVNPHDDRYKGWVGKQVRVPVIGRFIPVISDESIDKDFGTGCVKITPAHDFNDYAVGNRHRLPLITIFDLQAQILSKAKHYQGYGHCILTGEEPLPHFLAGKDREMARHLMVEALQKEGALIKTEPHRLMVPKGDRTGTIIEPMLTDQWFVSMNKTPKKGVYSLGRAADEAVEQGAVRFIPKNWVNTYRQWMEHLEDWCISRQLWWGHRIPAWYDEEGNCYVAPTEEEAKKQAGGKVLYQDEDVLDTWFSSALVPFATLGWPQETEALQCFFPSNVLVTGYEIIFFWVARMIMISEHFMGRAPFPEVYIHGIVRDQEGKKMSKSEGNVIDPVDLIQGVDLDTLLLKRTTGLRRPEKAEAIKTATKKQFPQGMVAYGADALRFTMASYASLGRNINFDLKRCEGYRNFCNKIWNASRFVLIHAEGEIASSKEAQESLQFTDRALLIRLNELIQQLNHAFDTYRFDLAAQMLYEFTWNEYCDWYLEFAKVQLKRGEKEAAVTRWVLLSALETLLRLLHPLMPFITEELWQEIVPKINRKQTESIVIAPWPIGYDIDKDEESLTKLSFLKEWIIAIRDVKTRMAIKPGVQPPLVAEGDEKVLAPFLPYIPALARVKEVVVQESLSTQNKEPIGLASGVRFLLRIEIDKAKEKERLQKEIDKLSRERDKLKIKLAQPGYIEKAPPSLVTKDKEALDEVEKKIEELKNQCQP